MNLAWLPNAITGVRILLIAPVLLLILSAEYGLALLLFIVAGFSDGLDGYLAKRYGWHTRLGALLDPVADKLLIAGLFLTLTSVGHIPLWLTVTVISRDLIILGGATAYNFLIGPVPGEPTMISKLNTALMLLFVTLLLCRLSFAWPDAMTLVVLGAATFVTVVVSGVDYVLSWSRRAREQRAGS
ncbi:MAG: CDP-alcohol phosphatidyltransferase family protein [Pseudomonadota bacterium]